MKIRRYNENKEEITWTTFNNHKAKDFLENVFIDFLEPTDKSKKASIKIEKIGYHTLAMWTINIPIDESSIDSIIDTMEDISGKIKYIEDSISKVRHSASLTKKGIEINIWSNQD